MQTNMNRWSAMPLIASFTCSFLPAIAAAQEPLEEITVTADYRSRPASEIPSSITIIDAATISETAVSISKS